MHRFKFLVPALAMSALAVAACDDDEPFDPGPVGTHLVANLTRAASVVPCGSVSGNGLVNVDINQAESVVSLTHFGFVNLSGPVRSAQIRSGAVGVQGPAIFDFGENPRSGLVLHFRAGDYPNPAPSGAPANFDAFVEALKAGNAYVAVNTDACPDGEVRGQLTVQTQ